MSVAARFYIQTFAKQAGGHATVVLGAATSKENAEWASFTPSGKIELSLTRKAGGARKFFEDHVGEDLAITFDVATEPRTEFGEVSKLWNENEAKDAEELGLDPPPVR